MPLQSGCSFRRLLLLSAGLGAARAFIGDYTPNDVQQNEIEHWQPAHSEAPYLVSLQQLNARREHVHFCYGTVLSAYLVLTAAHCYHAQQSRRPAATNALVGANTEVAARHDVISVSIHPLFSGLGGFDAALLLVYPAIRIDGWHVRKIDINVSLEQQQGAIMHMPRWSVDQRLEELKFRLVNTNNCRSFGYVYISPRQICAFSVGQLGACDGDSGAPLLNAERTQQLGVLSYGRRPCEPMRIYVSTAVSSLLDWITEHMARTRSTR